MKANDLIRTIGLIPVVLLWLTGCSEADGQQAAMPQAPEVGVYEVKDQSLVLSTDLPGRTVPYRIAEVRPQVNGIIQKRMFTEGSLVKEGDQLYQIDPAIYEAADNRAKANLNSASQLAQRYAKLVKANAVSKQQYDDAYAAWKLMEAERALTQINLEYTKVLSPITGRIGRSFVTQGALVTNGQPQQLATIQQLDPIYVDLTQPMTEVLRLRKELASGQLEKTNEDQVKVSLKLEDGSIYPLQGALQFSEVSVDPGTGSVTLRAEFPNPGQSLLPGMIVHARLSEGVRNAAILVPQQAVARNVKGEPMVWVVGNDNKVSQRTIKTERTVGNQWLVSDGLQAGEQIVAEGLQKLRPGIEVSTSPATNLDLKMDLAAVETSSASVEAKEGNQ